jgi:hypothetical protein
LVIRKNGLKCSTKPTEVAAGFPGCGDHRHCGCCPKNVLLRILKPLRRCFVGAAAACQSLRGDTTGTGYGGSTDRTLRLLPPPAGCDRHPRNSACPDAYPAGAATRLVSLRAAVETGDRIRWYPGRRSRTRLDLEPALARASIPGLFSASTRERRNRSRKSAAPSALPHHTTGRFLCHLHPAP